MASNVYAASCFALEAWNSQQITPIQPEASPSSIGASAAGQSSPAIGPVIQSRACHPSRATASFQICPKSLPARWLIPPSTLQT
ncbi:hypothetical protein SCP_0901420 [Sparassis crispa]|uniref:Uncharacterized protein n=1 Tax=Sparassis crispa TaxID=139825 RepID=A0A401GVQ2_9APHY|nr:hypothetical protein SCP_0901420 [Sparassis crispa]GBE86263.1 hypothetical protein SCP_0901420 [Sparassis crispa]